MGTGHVMRCLSLAQAWKACGDRSIFISHCESEPLRRRVEDSGVDFIPLEKPHPNPSDLQNTVSLLGEFQASWLVLDGYHFDPAFQKAVRTAGYRLLVIDDTAHWPEYHANILLNQNIDAEKLSYSCDSDTKSLLGTQYVLLRSEFLDWRGWQRRISLVPHKVLVTMGGSDPDNVTLKVIQALEQVDLPGLEARIVVGFANNYLEILRQAVERSTYHLQILKNVTDITLHMAWADIAVSAAGSTCWELAFMGLPSILGVLSENQLKIADGLNQAGIACSLGWFNRIPVPKITDTLSNLISTGELRSRMSKMGQQLVDGNGPHRVIESLQAGLAITGTYNADPIVS
jgi:UDP-2,4-diacetamido-2,4,6-trideoxy-beta-L-altropyranose hydrolase